MPWNNQSGGNGGGPWGSGGGNNGGGNRNPWGSRGPRGSGPNGPNFEDMIRRGGQSVRRVLPGGFWSFRGMALIILGVIVIWLATGFYRVDQREAGVELVFGRMVNATGPGLNWNWPAPIGETFTPSVKERRQLDIGFRASPGSGQVQAVVDESLMLTGDENIIDIQVTVFWKVDERVYVVDERRVQSGIRKFLFNIRNPQKTVKDAAESALREAVGLREFERIRTRDRSAIEEEVQKRVQKLLDEYGAGIRITNVTLRNADPPEEVRDAFRDVQAARADNDRLIQEATKHKNKVENEARGEAERLIARGDAYRQEQINKATGETTRFLAIYKQYESAKDITRQRIYLATMQELLSRMDKILVSQGSGGVVPYLPLRELRRGTSSAGRNNGAGSARERATAGPRR